MTKEQLLSSKQNLALGSLVPGLLLANAALLVRTFYWNKVRIGNNVKIQNNVSVYDNVTLEDDVLRTEHGVHQRVSRVQL